MAYIPMRRAALAIAMIAGLSSGEAVAGEDPCAGSRDEASMLACRQGEMTTSQAKLDAAVGALATGYGEEDRAAVLQAAQSAWTAFRDAECRLLTFDSRGGTAFDTYWAACITERNRERLETLARYADEP